MIRVTLEIDLNLAERCRDLAEWRATGRLNQDGPLAAQAAELTEIGARAGLSFAEYKTQTEIVDAVAEALRLAKMPIS